MTVTPCFYQENEENPSFRNVCTLVVGYSRHGGPGSVVGIATGYGLDGPGIESRWGARFPAPVQTGPGALPSSCTMGTGSYRGKERPRRDADPSPLLVLWSWKGRAIPLLPLWAVRPVQSLSACTGVHFTYIQYIPIPYFCYMFRCISHHLQRELNQPRYRNTTKIRQGVFLGTLDPKGPRTIWGTVNIYRYKPV